MTGNGEIGDQVFDLIMKRFDQTDKKIDDGFARVNGGQGKQDDRLDKVEEWQDKRSGAEMVMVWIIPIGISTAIAVAGFLLK